LAQVSKRVTMGDGWPQHCGRPATPAMQGAGAPATAVSTTPAASTLPAASALPRRRLVDGALLLYTGSCKDVRRVLTALYAASVRFEDPLVRIQGRTGMTARFFALKVAFVVASARLVSVAEEPGRVVLQYVLRYRMTRLWAFEVAQTTTLLLDASGAVCVHVDEWHHSLGLLAQLPWPICHSYDLWRSSLALISLVVTSCSFSLFQTLLSCGVSLVCSMFSIAALAYDVAFCHAFGTQLALSGVLGSLLDIRGACVWGAPVVATSEFEGITAVIVGDFGEVCCRIAWQFARGGVRALHLVGPSESKLAEVVTMLRNEACSVTTHCINFAHPGEVVLWCKTTCQRLEEQNQQVGVLVLSSVMVTPKEQRFTLDALDQAFAADVVGLQALLRGLCPALAADARVVVTASAACCWLSRLSRKALSAGTAADAGWLGRQGQRLSQQLDALQARAQQQAARVVLAEHQACKWVEEGSSQEGSDGQTGQIPVCVSCTPTGCWSAWTDLLAWAGLLDPLRSLGQSTPGLRMFVASVHAFVTERIADTVVHLCSPYAGIAPGEYYWGRCPALGVGMVWPGASRKGKATPGFASNSADIGKMFVVLALRSGQLPG